MITFETKHRCLEKRVEFMTDFINAMRKNDVSEELLGQFIESDLHFLYTFCDKIDQDPEYYIGLYHQRLKEPVNVP